MMAQAQKQFLHELLKEDQEPFQLKNYISDRKIQLKKRKPVVETETLKQSLCKHACFFSFLGSPDVRKSPVGFPSPVSPGRTRNGRVLLHVPARTAALLLEAAMRIHGSGKLDTRIKNCGLGLFGSVLKRLKERNNKSKLREIKNIADQHELGFSCAYNQSRLSSAGWSESNEEEKSLDLEASSSFRSEEFEEIVDSPLSPFQFSLHRCPSSGHRTPEFSSPATSPCLHKRQDKENCEDEDLENAKQEEEDNKEQCSPVSVLDHPFEDDDYRPDEEDECNYSTLQRAQQELLHKLHRFEQLAELDPIELEKLMLEEEEEEYEEDNEDVAEYADRCGANMERVICCRDGEINPYMKMLVSDQSSEEKAETNGLNNRKLVWGRVCNRLDNLCRTEFEEWKSCHEQAEEIAMEIEVVMFGVLVEELSQELSGSIK